MRVLVAIKRVIDAYVKVRVKADGSGIESGNVKMTINPFDEIAVEEAVRLKEAGKAEEIVVVSIGEDKCQETIRGALAMGADRGIHVQSSDDLQPLAIARLLKAIVDREQPELIILGKQAIDDDSNQTGQMLAGLLDWPQATFASEVQLDNDEVQVTREIDGGQETLTLQMPALITTDLRLNEPRYTTLPNLIKAKKKPIDVVSSAELGVDITSRLQVLKVEEPPEHAAGIRIDSVAELIDKLKVEAKVLP